MAYSDLIDEENIDSQYLVVMRPRRRVEGFTLFSGSTYQVSFDYGYVYRVEFDGAVLTDGTSSSLSADQYYYDQSANILYVRLTSGLDPDTGWLVVTYEIYAGTIDAHHNRIPTDNSSDVVYFEPIISKSNNIKQTTDGALFGFSPTQTSNLALINAEHLFEKHLHSSTWNKCDVLVYHWLGDLDSANMKFVLNGLCLSIQYNPPLVSLRVVDRIDILSKEFSHPSGVDQLYSVVEFPELDPLYTLKPIRMVYGRVDGFVPVNVDYLDQAPTTSDNRTWAVCSGQTNLSDVVRTVAASPISTTTRTYLTSVSGLNIGDSVWLDKASDEYAIITDVGANYIDHAALSVACSSGDLVKRAFIGAISIVQDDVEYIARYQRDYTITTALNSNCSGFVFNTSLETNIGLPNTLKPTDKVFCRVYGPSNYVTLGGPSYGSNDTRTANLAHPSQIVLDLLKRCIGVSESEVEANSFTQALTDQSSGIGISIPDDAGASKFPKYRDIISQILKSCLAKLIINADGKWSMLTLKPLGAVSKTIADDEILVDSVSWDYDYDDVISKVVIEYDAQETGPKTTLTQLVSTVYSDSFVGKYLHKTDNVKTERSLWIYETEAQELADRMAFILGERSGEMVLRAKNRFYSVSLGDNIEVQRAYLPGFDVDGETIFTREHGIAEIDKSRTQVTIKLDDRKGIEDNSGGW